MEQLGISKLDLKRQNRMFILNTIKNRGPISRVDIAMLLELTRAAVTIITNEMIAQGILYEVGEAPSSGDRNTKGRKKILIDINRNYKFAFGVSVEHDLVSAGLSTLSGDVLDKKSLSFVGNISFEEIMDFMIKTYESILKENYLESSRILGFGLGIHPQMYDIMRVAETEGGGLCYDEILSVLSERISVPITCGNAVSLLAMANMEFKAGAGAARLKNICLIQCGRSFDAAIISLDNYEESLLRKTDIIEDIIVNNCGNKIGCGTVRDELTPTAMRNKLEFCSSEAEIISLYNEMINRSAAGTLGEMLDSISLGDTRRTVIKEAVEQFAALMCNIYISGIAQKIYINRFYLQNVDVRQMIQMVIKRCPPYMEDVLAESKFTGKFTFLGGCALAVYKFFFLTGGIQYTEL